MSELQDRLDALGKLDCAIVGGGVSGLYAGYRMLTANPKLRVAIFELGDRVGGRLLTWLPNGPEAGLRAELGGMRFFKQQELVWNCRSRAGRRYSTLATATILCASRLFNSSTLFCADALMNL